MRHRSAASGDGWPYSLRTEFAVLSFLFAVLSFLFAVPFPRPIPLVIPIVKRTSGLAHVSPGAQPSPQPAKRGGRSNARGSSNLIALGSAAVMAVYVAGFVRTKPAADRMAAENADGPRRRAPAAAGGGAGAVAAAGSVSVAALAGESSATASASAMTATSPSGTPAAQTAAAANTNANANSSSNSPSSAHHSDIAASSSASAKNEVGDPKHVESSSSASTPAAASTHEATTGASAASSTVTSAATAPASAPVTTPPATQSAAPAPAAAPSPAPAEAPAAPVKVVYKDGAYIGRGTSRHGDIEAMVEIKDGKITSTIITQCLTRYSCSWVNPLLPQVAQRQSAEIDYVSGATQSSNALYYAVLQALSQAK